MSWETRLIRAVVGILRRDGKVLVAERPAGKPYSGYWEFPGGKIEENESGAHALKRELHEELGIDILAAEFWFEHHHAYPDKTVYLEMWLVNDFIGEPHSKENQQLRWVDLAEILELRLLEGNWPIIDKIKTLFH
jgi:8-oxo-dGTP diphosphatase